MDRWTCTSPRAALGFGLSLLLLATGPGCILVTDADDGEDGSGTGSDLEPGECIGPEEQLEPPSEPACDDGTCAPTWSLEDFQPRSCGFGDTYGLNTFEGQVTVVALLAGWCGFCQAQAQKMEQMRIELKAEGVDVMFVAINGTSADNAGDRASLTDQCSFPLFQDTDEVSAWAQHGGNKDDIYVYNSDGSLSAAFEYSVSADAGVNLSTDEGYDALRTAVLAAE